MLRFSWLGLCLVACTLAPQDPYSGVGFATGVAPFEEKGPLQLCVATHRITSPGRILGGFCQKKDAPLRKDCTYETDCRGRETCVCGKCTVKFCTRSDECPQGMTCDFQNARCVLTCKSDCDCPGPNGRCDLGICQQMCIIDGECQAGELCSLNRARCITAPCNGDSDCLADEECVVQVEPRFVSEPHPVVGPDGTMYLYLEMNQGALERRVIFRATSDDGITWKMTPPAPVIESESADGYFTGAPSVLLLAGRYVMYFEVDHGRYFGRATSEDGRRWVRDSTPVLLPAHDEPSIHSPAVILDPTTGRVRLYYTIGDGVAVRSVLSDDPQGTSFSSLNRQTVLTPDVLVDPVLWRAVSRVRSPFVTVEGNGVGQPLYRMWVAAYGFESGIAESFGTVDQVRANYSIGYLVSTDGITFIPYSFNPVFDRVAPNSFVNHESEMCPAVLSLQGKTVLLYGISNADAQTWDNLGWAINPPRHDAPDTLQ